MGADALWSRGVLGQGQTVAVLDEGFAGLDRSIALGELPPREAMTIRAFDPASGLDGTHRVRPAHPARRADGRDRPRHRPGGPPGAGRLPHPGPVRGGRRLDRRPGHPGREPLQLVPHARPSTAPAAPPGRWTRPPPPACSGSTRPGNYGQRHWRGTAPPERRRASRSPRPPGRRCCSASPGAAPGGHRERGGRAPGPGGRVGGGAAQRARAAPRSTRSPAPRLTTDAGAWRRGRAPGRRPARPSSTCSRTPSASARSAVADGSIPTPGDAAGALTRGRREVDRHGPRALLVPGGGRQRPAKPDLVGPTYVTSNPEWPGTAGTSAADRPRRGRRGAAAPGAPRRGPARRRRPTCARCSRGTAPRTWAAGARSALRRGDGPHRHHRARRCRCAIAPGARPARAGARRRRGYDPRRAHLHERAHPAGGPPPRGGRAAAGAAAAARTA